LESTDYPNYDDVLIDLKLLPEDMEIPVPELHSPEKIKEIKEREETLVRKMNVTHVLYSTIKGGTWSKEVC
jgi:translation elongation factor EF-1beta